MIRRTLEDEQQPARIPGWALTYIDLMWLLLLFFILRSAVGAAGAGRHFHEITAALKKRFGVEAAINPGEGGDKKAAIASAPQQADYREVVREGLEGTAIATQRSLAVQGVIYFSAGDPRLQNEQKQILQAVAEQIGHSSALIEIRGEAAEKAVEAAYARCAAARSYLIRLGIDPGRLRIAIEGARRLPLEKPCVRLYSVTEMVAETSAKSSPKR